MTADVDHIVKHEFRRDDERSAEWVWRIDDLYVNVKYFRNGAGDFVFDIDIDVAAAKKVFDDGFDYFKRALRQVQLVGNWAENGIWSSRNVFPEFKKSGSYRIRRFPFPHIISVSLTENLWFLLSTLENIVESAKPKWDKNLMKSNSGNCYWYLVCQIRTWPTSFSGKGTTNKSNKGGLGRYKNWFSAGSNGSLVLCLP